MTSLPEERQGRKPGPALAERRQAIAAMLPQVRARLGAAASTQDLGGVRVLRIAPPGAPRGVFLHFHGGGFRVGAPELCGRFALDLAARCGVDVILPAYRLAPEHPFPSGLADGQDVLHELWRQGVTHPILSGDSAGGNLAAALTRLAVAEGKKPAGLVLLSAFLDLTVSGSAYEENADSDAMLSRGKLQAAAAQYLQGWRAADPLASPLLGDVAGFPPALVNAGAGEVLAGDARRFHEKLQAAGVPAQLQLVPGMAHVAVTRRMDAPGARPTFEAIVSLIEAARPAPSA